MRTQKDRSMMSKAFSVFLLVSVQYISAEISNLECPQIHDEGRTNLVFTHPDTGIALRAVYSIKKTDKREIEVLSFRGVACGCEQFSCQCCVGLDVSWLPKLKGCISTRHIPEDNAVKIALKFDEEEVLSTTIPDKDPLPLCVRIPFDKTVKACVMIRKLEVVENDLRACINLLIRKLDTQYFLMQFKCFEVGPGELSKSLPGQPAVLNLSPKENNETEVNQHAKSKDE